MPRTCLLALTFVLTVSTFALAQAEDSETMLTYSRGQAVIPAYEGFHPNPDGSTDLWFGYLNQNYAEELDIPVGADNNITPAMYGPDGGQPTHFLPRNNRWQFKVRVPKDFNDKELVWTLTSHGKTYKAYATLKPAYLHDDIGMQREYFGEPPVGGNKPPEIKVDGALQRTVKVGEASTLAIVATDDGQPPPIARRPPARSTLTANLCGDNPQIPITCGTPNESAGSMFIIRGFRMVCFPYRGPARAITFDPPQEKAWEDHRGGTPFATGYVYPPIPKDNRWVIQTKFDRPGTYVVRCRATDTLLSSDADITFNVTP